MIIGIGTDIVDIDRIRKSIAKHGERFLTRNFSHAEITAAQELADATAYFAKRFAAKEAFAKALGTGIGENAAFKDITTLNNELGAPYILLTGAAAASVARIEQNNAGNRLKIHISLSDEKQYAQAFVILDIG